MRRRLLLDHYTEQLVWGQCFYDPGEHTKLLLFCEMLGARDELLGEKHETIDDCATIETVELREILAKLFLISNTAGNGNCNKILNCFFLYWKSVDSTLQTHSIVETLRNLITEMGTRKVEKSGFRRVAR